MTDELTHTVELNIPNHVWEKVKLVLREIRCVVRDAGGTSKMTKSNNLVTLRVTGPSQIVLDVVENAHKLNRKIAQVEDNARHKFKRDLIRRATSQREENMNAVLDKAFDIMQDRRNKK